MSNLYAEPNIDGLLQSDSLVDLQTADTYFKGKVGADVWSDLDCDISDDGGSSVELQVAFKKLQALVDATRRINNLKFKGCKVDVDQTHAFPRGADTTVPKNIQYATCELAYELLDGTDDNLEMENLGVLSQRFSGIATSHERESVPVYIVAGIPSVLAWRYLSPYLRDPRELRVVRV